MKPHRQLNPNPKIRKRLRVIGFVCLFLGLPMLIVGLIDFFMSFGSMRTPTLFFFAMIGLPLTGVGAMFLQQGYLGSYSRYVAGEISPVAVDTANYLYEGTKDNMRDLANTFGQAMQGKAIDIHCTRCGHSVQPTDRYCDNCGSPMRQNCPHCQTSNDGDARFCRQCGKEIR